MKVNKKTLFEQLKDIGIDASLFLAGMFGRLLKPPIANNPKWWEKVIYYFTGGATANYLTPVVIQIFGFMESSKYGIAFVIGTMGINAIEILLTKIREKI